MNNTYSFNIIPNNDKERVAALNRYRIFNTPAEPGFDQMAALAATIFKVPIAHISFLDGETEFVKANTGIAPDPFLVDRGESLCALTILRSEFTTIENALLEPILDNHPYVHGEFGLRFYAGAPIITSDNYMIGTMCLVDREPRRLTEHEIRILMDLADVVMEQVELRLSNIEKSEKQQHTYEMLLRNQKRLKGILDTMAEGVVIVDANGRSEYANQMAQRMFALPEAEILAPTYKNTGWQNLQLNGEPLPADEHPIVVMLKKGIAAYDQEIGIRQPDGEVLYISVNTAPIVNDEGKITGGIATFMDVTNRRKLMKQKDEFISIASHELKTPITGLKASLQFLDKLKNDPSSPVIPKMITQANKSLEKLSQLVNDLLDVNRIVQGQLQLRKTTFVIADMINDCCQQVRTAGNYEIKLHGDTELTVQADEQRVDQVVINIVNNAIKYAPESKQIDITIEKLKNMAKISITDYGPGITAEKLPHLFERYYRADYSGLQFSGLGLGLYISADIIKKHGGEIGADTEPGKGSTFWFTLPLT